MKTRASASGIIGQAKGFLLRRASPWTGRFSDCATICRSFALGRNPNEISTRTPNERSLLAHGSVEKRENNEDDYRRSAPDVGRHRLVRGGWTRHQRSPIRATQSQPRPDRAVELTVAVRVGHDIEQFGNRHLDFNGSADLMRTSIDNSDRHLRSPLRNSCRTMPDTGSSRSLMTGSIRWR